MYIHKYAYGIELLLGNNLNKLRISFDKIYYY
jgi:hypothetical protein